MQATDNKLPFIGVILSEGREERFKSVMNELDEQGLLGHTDFFPSIHDKRSVKAGISKAHKQIIRVAKMAGCENVVVMEDDVRFCGKGAFKYFLDHTPKDYDIYLGCIYTGHIDENNETKAFSGFMCYMVHERYYDTFLEADEEQHIDRAQAWKGRFIVSKPFICCQHNFWSHNSKKDENLDSLLAGRKFLNDYFVF